MVAIGFAAALWMPDTRRYGYLEGTGEVERRSSRPQQRPVTKVRNADV
jgi:hypothetical protein